MSDEQFEAVKSSVRAAFAQMSGEDVQAIVMDTYAEFRQESP